MHEGTTRTGCAVAPVDSEGEPQTSDSTRPSLPPDLTWKKLRLGDIVYPIGLVSRPDLNGVQGTVIEECSAADVQREGKLMVQVAALQESLSQFHREKDTLGSRRTDQRNLDQIRTLERNIERTHNEMLARGLELDMARKNSRIGVRFCALRSAQVGLPTIRKPDEFKLKFSCLVLIRRWEDAAMQSGAVYWGSNFLRGAGEKVSRFDGGAHATTPVAATVAVPSKALVVQWNEIMFVIGPDGPSPKTTGSLEFSVPRKFEIPAMLDAKFCALAFAACLPASVADCDYLRKVRGLIFNATSVSFSVDDIKALLEEGHEESDAALVMFDMLDNICEETEKKTRATLVSRQSHKREDTCNICLQTIDTEDTMSNHLMHLPCCRHKATGGLVYHTACVANLRKVFKGGSCPACGDPLPQNVIRRKIMIPTGLQPGDSFNFKQNQTNLSGFMQWRIVVPQGMQGGDVMQDVCLDCGENMAWEESLHSISLDTQLERFMQTSRCIRTFDLMSTKESTCQDCGCCHSFGKIEAMGLTLQSRARSNDDSMESLEDCIQRIMSMPDACRPCMENSWDGWRFVKGVWRLDVKEWRVCNGSSKYILSLPVVLPIHLDRSFLNGSDDAWNSASGRFQFANGNMDIPLENLDLAPFFPRGFDLGTRCSRYNLRLMIKLQRFGPQKETTQAGVGGRYMGYFKAMGSSKWYAYDVCKGMKQVPELDGVRRMTTRYATFLLYVRADVDAAAC